MSTELRGGLAISKQSQADFTNHAYLRAEINVLSLM